MRAIDKLKLALGEEIVRDDEEHLVLFSRDSSDHPGNSPLAVIHPRDVSDVIKAVDVLYSEKIPITPRGSGTSLSGGSVPTPNGVVISFDRMNRIKDIDTENLLVVVEPGVITGELIHKVREYNLFYPPDPASLESCTIGGNVAENAGGPRAFKYGTTKHYVLELEVVIKNGQVVRFGKRTKKWVVGYDIPMLITGSEGTLGLITEITLRLIPKPPKTYTLLAAFPDEVKAGISVSKLITKSLFPSSVELVDHKCINAVGDIIAPFLPKDTGAFLLVEFDGFGYEFEKQVEIAYDIFERNGVIDVFVAEDESTRERLWSARRKVLPSLESMGKLIRHEDVVVPRNRIPDLIIATEKIEKEFGLPITNFGHAADGNIHVNILYDKGQEDIMRKVVDRVMDEVISIGGTCAGEHGIGLLKKKHLRKELPPLSIEIQRNIKKIFDPENLFNPDKIF